MSHRRAQCNGTLSDAIVASTFRAAIYLIHINERGKEGGKEERERKKLRRHNPKPPHSTPAQRACLASKATRCSAHLVLHFLMLSSFLTKRESNIHLLVTSLKLTTNKLEQTDG